MVYPITKLWFYPLLKLTLRKIVGSQNIPTDSNFIIVSNHEKLIDPLLIIYPVLRKLDKKVHFLATPTWKFLGETICWKWAGCIPLYNSKQAYLQMKKCLKQNEIVGIFPEGRLDKSKRYPKTGAVRLAFETKAAILPVGIKSSYLLFNSRIAIGKPIKITKAKKFEAQTNNLMRYVYKLRNKK